jgi:hypothetical protein
MTSTRRARGAAALLALVLVTGLGACTSRSGDEEPPTPPETTTASTAPTLTVRHSPLKLRVNSVRGELRPAARAQLRARLGRAIGTWMETGFVAGEHPRRDFSSAFASYTPRAAALARRQRAVTTNVTLAPELVEAVPTGRVANVSALAVGGRVVGATAQVLLVLVGARDDGTQVELAVRGRLDLTPTAQGWKVFGFDLTRSTGAPGAFAAALQRVRQQKEEQQQQAREKAAERTPRGRDARRGGRNR